MTMRLLPTSWTLVLVLTAVLSGAAEPTPQGVFSKDLDRGVLACTDFYEFANGAWRAQNPIPGSQVRWSRRWASGETAKDQLKVILEEVSAKSTWPKGSVEQLIGDDYAACMDQPRIDQLGRTPVE